MKTVLIGSGNVAHHIAKSFVNNEISIVQIFGRNENALREISTSINIPYSTVTLEEADIYIIAVSDSSIEDVSKLIKNPKALVAHTSGSLPIDTLVGEYRKACFYPLQTFSKNKDLNYSEIPFFIESQNKSDAKLLLDLASKISNNVMEINYEKRKYIHLTAVFSCNFVNHLFSRAKEISDSQNIPFHYFYPLICETVEKINYLDPKSAQTGPAVRNDARILDLHEKLINNSHLEIYKTMNLSIKEMYEL